MADGSAMNLPAYRVRVSQRAKNVSIHISHQGEVEVVVPQTFDLKQVPEIVSKRQDWITRTTQRLELERLTAPAPVTETLPKKITLRSLPEDWRVVYTPRRSHQLTASSTRNHQINLQGPTDNVAACQLVLQRWLSRKAQLHLVPLVAAGEPGGQTALWFHFSAYAENPLGQLLQQKGYQPQRQVAVFATSFGAVCVYP